ncbi:MAG: helix-turn-helix domain-containing protein [Thermovirgaceae bacterium]|nr:helix-turn-helix domain-containing protein [Thermovirgaceae bacterium]
MPKIVDHDVYRDELAIKCFDLFARKGYSAVTMREIAWELKVSTGTLYHYFPSKMAILEQVFFLTAERDVADGVSRVQNFTAPADRMKVFLEWVAELELHFADVLLITIDYHRQEGHDAGGLVASVLATYTDAVAFYVLPDRELSALVMTYLIGLITERIIIRENIDFTARVDALYRFVLQCLEHQGQEPPASANKAVNKARILQTKGKETGK